MFYDVNDGNIASNGDYNSSNLSPVINKLKENTSNLFQWSRNNHMKTNADWLLEPDHVVTIHQRNLQVLVA